MKKIIITFIILVHSFNNINGQTLKDQIDSILSISVNRSLPGGAVLVQQKDSILYTKYFGKADLSHDIDIDDQTVFNIGSVSKQFTVFAILLLEDQGKLSLQDDIHRYIPELTDFGHKITIEQLIRHTSGLKSVNFLARMAGWRQTDLSTHDQMLKLLFRQKKLDYIPGTDYKYSNSGTMLLAEVVSRVSEKSFAEFMNDEVFYPLGMKYTFVRDDIAEIFKHEAHGYYWENGKLKKAINSHGNIGFTNVYSTVEDLALWALNYKNPVVGNQQIIEKMESPTVLPNKITVDHAMGQFITTYKGIKHIQHTGGHRAYVAYFGRFPDLDLDIVICSNVEGFDLFGTTYQIIDLFIEEIPDQNTQVDHGKAPYINLEPNIITRYHGYYWLDEANVSRQVLSRNDTLIYSRGEDNHSYFKPVSKTEFQMLDSKDKIIVKFEKDKMYFIEPNGISEFEKYHPVVYNEAALGDFVGTYYSRELNSNYELLIEDNRLKAKSPKMKEITFFPIMENRFTSDQWFLNSARFVRDTSGTVMGFYAGNVQVKDVWFMKMK